jgi:hypothetical protein
LPAVSGAPDPLRVTLNETLKALPANGCAGTVAGGPMTGFPTADTLPLAAVAAAITVTDTNTSEQTSVSARPALRMSFLLYTREDGRRCTRDRAPSDLLD